MILGLKDQRDFMIKNKIVILRNEGSSSDDKPAIHSEEDPSLRSG